jgi:hypothetical protein
MSKTVTVPDDWCERCRGKGTVALHGIAITSEEWWGPDWDDESREAYLDGFYDTPCDVCGGSGRIDPEELADRLEYLHEIEMGY